MPERKEVTEFYLNLRHFMNMFERVDENYVLYSDFDETDRFCLHLYCVNPSVNLQECLERGKSTVFFSATLLPVNYYKNLLSSKKIIMRYTRIQRFARSSVCCLSAGMSAACIHDGPLESFIALLCISNRCCGQKGKLFDIFSILSFYGGCV